MDLKEFLYENYIQPPKGGDIILVEGILDAWRLGKDAQIESANLYSIRMVSNKDEG